MVMVMAASIVAISNCIALTLCPLGALRFVQRGSLWDMLRRAQADPSQLPWSRRLKFAAEVHWHAHSCKMVMFGVCRM